MIKYIILSVIAYYIITYYVAPMIESNKNTIKRDGRNSENNKNHHDDDYIDYEEVK
ncbi:MAG: hypothetical protein IPK35_23085 [Saprospiraceae bacterium]|jgi:hypothetical protein|nr:hypothetical protein [Saprospiraceae bacterium]